MRTYAKITLINGKKKKHNQAEDKGNSFSRGEQFWGETQMRKNCKNSKTMQN